MTEDQMRALFLLAGFNVTKHWMLPNKYWPESYADLRKASPWWLAMTEHGPIEIGWRKRVISINWEATGKALDAQLTDENVTKDSGLIHAWSTVKALEYLTELRHQMAQAATSGQEQPA